MTRSSWKATERRIAKILGGERVPVSGRARGSTPDVKHDWLSVEVKARASLPAWIGKAMGQAKAAAKPGQLPVAVLHASGDDHRDALVVVKLRDFQEWFGKGPTSPEVDLWEGS